MKLKEMKSVNMGKISALVAIPVLLIINGVIWVVGLIKAGVRDASDSKKDIKKEDKTMNEIIKSYLESNESFNRFFGADGLVSISQSSVHPKLLDFQVEGTAGYGRPIDADDLKEIGTVFLILSDKLKEKENK